MEDTFYSGKEFIAYKGNEQLVMEVHAMIIQ